MYMYDVRPSTLTFHLLFRYTLATGIKFIAQKETSDRGRGGGSYLEKDNI